MGCAEHTQTQIGVLPLTERDSVGQRASREPARVPDNKVDEVQEDREREHNEESVPSQELPNSEFTAELNLFIVFLSLFSSSTEESLDSVERVEREPERRKDGAKAIKRLQKKRPEIDEVKPVRRPTQRFQTTIRDSRHGRRV